MRLLSLLVSLGASALGSGVGLAPFSASPPPAVSLYQLLSRVDEAWKSRDEPGRLEEIASLLARAEERAPRDYDVLWRLARLYAWTSDDPAEPAEERSRLGRKAWGYGDRATSVDPRGVEGWFYAAAGVGNYALGIGVLKALTQGIEGEFKERLSRAEALAPGFLRGAIWSAWGRFYYELPWPKYDAKRSERYLRMVIRANPAEERGRVYLAELYDKEGDPKGARKLLEEAVALEPGSYDAPEERRYRERARRLLARMR
jgi:tetratricopeptide (TPR) repeat protein